MFAFLPASHLVAPLSLLLSVAPSQGKKDLEQKTFTCPMHSQIIMPAQGLCPICGMNLVPRSPGIKKVEIPEGGLTAWCSRYLEHALENRPGNADLLLPAYVALHGPKSAKKVRALLKNEDGPWFAAAASQLGRMKDMESVPLLEKLLADPKFAIKKSYYCPDHPLKASATPGKCDTCKRSLVVSFGRIYDRVCLAGALHQLGQDSGEQALLKIARKGYGGEAIHHLAIRRLAHRDTPRVRKLLVEATRVQEGLTGRDKARATTRRAQAICAQIRLGIDTHFAEAIRHLESPEGWLGYGIFQSLGASGMKDAKKPLVEVMRNRKLPWENRIAAATTLIQLGVENYQGFLFGAYEQTAGPIHRPNVYLAWAEVGDKRALPFLKSAIESGENRSFAVIAAARILGRMQAPVEKD